MKLFIGLLSLTVIAVVVGNEDTESTRLAPYVPDKCNYDAFLRFEHRYKSRCEFTDHYHFHKERHYLNLLDEYKTLRPELKPCHFIHELKSFFDKELFSKCGQVYHYFASSRSCVEEAETDTSAEFGDCFRFLSRDNPERAYECKDYVKCIHDIYLDKCGKRALAMTCDRYIATFRDLQTHLGHDCDSWDNFYDYCESVTPY
uniref:DUF19 domain-containing protein n=1 Tax=Steinernema glaseri TaxID=37863 RepID=A0A1I7YKM5_9BILA